VKKRAQDQSEFERFDSAMETLLELPREEYQKRLADWKAEPGARGPKRKVKPVSEGLDTADSH
jgi:hypothetical protein